MVQTVDKDSEVHANRNTNFILETVVHNNLLVVGNITVYNASMLHKTCLTVCLAPDFKHLPYFAYVNNI